MRVNAIRPEGSPSLFPAFSAWVLCGAALAGCTGAHPGTTPPSSASSPTGATGSASATPARSNATAGPPGPGSSSAEGREGGVEEPPAPPEPLSASAFDEIVAKRRRALVDGCTNVPEAPGKKRGPGSETVRLRLAISSGRVVKSEPDGTATPRVSCVQQLVSRWSFPTEAAPSEHRLVVMFVTQ